MSSFPPPPRLHVSSTGLIKMNFRNVPYQTLGYLHVPPLAILVCCMPSCPGPLHILFLPQETISNKINSNSLNSVLKGACPYIPNWANPPLKSPSPSARCLFTESPLTTATAPWFVQLLNVPPHLPPLLFLLLIAMPVNNTLLAIQ